MIHGRPILGPWQPPAPRVEGDLFEALPDEVQCEILRLAFRDLARYYTDFSDDELWWLLAHLPPGPVRVSTLSRSERVRVAGVLLPLLRRRAGWAA